MQFSKLRVTGFKSFVDPAEFQIEPGLTGVIGPNGCGKSNLVEALRWVMGENSYKSMRASSMDDVIFAGGGDRPARNMAEVGLVLDNAARTAPAQFNAADIIEVTRRIEREEGSTYRINGREVRARDVQILFADASSGARSPSLVRQGQISEIIAAKPQSRRRILEEAAGVAGLHTRRHEAELRLKGAEDNLSRIDDVLTQISAQGDGLRRQARQAQRYKELQAEIRRLHALSILTGYEEALTEAAGARETLDAANARAVESTRHQAATAREQAVAAYGLPALREAETEAGAALQRLIVARATLDGEERRAQGALAEIERRIKDMNAERARDGAAIEDAAGVLARLEAEAEEIGGRTLDAEADLDLREAIAEAEMLRLEAERDLSALQRARAEAEANRGALAGRLRDETARFDRLGRDLQTARQTRETLLASLEDADGFEAAAERLDIVTETAERASEAQAEAELALAAAREREAASRGPLTDADRSAQKLETEAQTLGKMLDAAQGAKYPPVTERITAEKGYEPALGAALGDDLEASSDPAAPAHWALVPGGDPALPQGAVPLLHFVDAPQALHRALAQTGVVERAQGLAMRGQLKAGQRLVSREGDIWRWDGFTQAAEAPTPAARRLTARNRLADLRLEAGAARERAEGLRLEADAAQTALQEAQRRETAARATQQSARRALDIAREQHAQAGRRRNESSAKLAALEATEAGTQALAGEAALAKAKLEDALAALGPAVDLSARFDEAQASAARHRAAETSARSSLQSLAREREAAAKRLAAIASESQSWIKRQEQADTHREDLDARIREALHERDELAEAPNRFILARRTILSDIEAAEKALRQTADARQAGETGLAKADREARAAIEAMGTAREDKARAETRMEVATVRLDTVTKAARADLDCEPEGLPALAGVKPGEARPAADFIAGRLEALRQDREKLGAVNLRAEEELAAIEEQRGALDKEREDLTEAIRRLRQAINSLNKEGRERLLAAFTAVNTHFKDLFTTLFGGGTAELQLVESDDPLEAGLEIMARPPGKKPQVMTLLSGGEQALTALSLIFAVFLTNPSPVCVLDEVDAPLDDANVERFCDLLDEMRTRTGTRFITITHNPISMARMDRLFGVTQAERGISQLVSVNLSEAERLLEVV